MIGYVMVGTNDIDRARKFFDAVTRECGDKLVPRDFDDGFVAAHNFSNRLRGHGFAQLADDGFNFGGFGHRAAPYAAYLLGASSIGISQFSFNLFNRWQITIQRFWQCTHQLIIRYPNGLINSRECILRNKTVLGFTE